LPSQLSNPPLPTADTIESTKGLQRNNRIRRCLHSIAVVQSVINKIVGVLPFRSSTRNVGGIKFECLTSIRIMR
jgi:hypothetical protein